MKDVNFYYFDDKLKNLASALVRERKSGDERFMKLFKEYSDYLHKMSWSDGNRDATIEFEENM